MSEENGSAEGGQPEGAAAPEGQATDTNSTDFLSTIENADLKSWAETKGITNGEQALSSYHNLEKVFGADKAGRTVTLLGDEPSAEDFSAFHNKLGRPEESKGYGFNVAEGQDSTFADAAKTKFHEIGLTDKQAVSLNDWWGEQAGAAAEAGENTAAENAASAEASLRKEWGAAYDKNVAAIDAAAVKLDISDDQLAGLNKAWGGADAMKFVHSLSEKLGEDTLEGEDTNIGG
ncbi:MAG: hypothetical protein KAI73_04605, partial [Rhodospirillaceae bacterium]|nr:hypothetical protein [Rhodospirillaceae bacterium]